MNTKQLILVSVFAALIAIGAQISIPLGPLPITLQAPMVVLAGSLLGRKYGVFSVVIYILLGLIGIPVFAGGTGGIGILFSPSFGFVIGFLVLAYCAGISTERERSLTLSSGIISIGVTLMFAIGLLYFYFIMNFVLITPVSIVKAIGFTITPFIIKDLLLAVGTLLFSNMLIKRGIRV